MKRIIYLILCFISVSCMNNPSEIPLHNKKSAAKDDWLFIVYMAADNDLENYAIQDFNEMEAGFEPDSGYKILLLFDRSKGYDATNEDWTESRLYEIKKDKGGLNGTIVSKQIPCSELDLYLDKPTELDLGNPNVLANFLDFSLKNYPAEKTALIFWGHGSGWRYGTETKTNRAVAMDDTSNTFLDVPSMGQALRNKSFEYIIFDTCFGTVIENLYEIKDNAQYIAGVPGLAPLSGLDYQKFFKTFNETDKDDEGFLRALFDSSCSELSLINSAKLQEVQKAVNDFSKSLSNGIQTSEDRNRILERLFTNVSGYQAYTYPCDLYLDLLSLSNEFKADPLFATESNRLNSVLKEALVYGEGIGIHFIPLVSRNVAASRHSDYYFNNTGGAKSQFVQNTDYWVPGSEGKSLLDKLFYKTY
ncbi:MAG: hypothetical protein HUK25_09595 [Treponema sp.]|nr:hypothetical protein [Treponema sp.]